ncbi:MAG: FRG domain-containing protein [Phycisphaeraceae bacterium]|nr:FRG domain-containing protein [Phycisphaeraceae bacterium]
MAILDSAFKPESGHLWFRGHADLRWRLAPSALRFRKKRDVQKALCLLAEFRRIADFRINRPPPFNDGLKWTQLAQHYGLPTRLLDWTSNAAIALYFACLLPENDGMVFVMDPTELNIHVLRGDRRLLDPEEDQNIIKRYLKLPPEQNPRGQKRTIAIQPIINSERIQLQRGAFTLHGNRECDLTADQAPSLCFIPILSEHKLTLLTQLGAIGIDELSIFPEPEHICSHLKRTAGLTGDTNA